MKRVRVAVLLALVAGCGEKSTTPPRGPSLANVDRLGPFVAPHPSAAADEDGIPADLVSAARAQSGGLSTAAGVAFDAPPVGHLERQDRLERLFALLARLESGQATDDARIVQFGDSHTASDTGTSVFRRALQARFGDGGRGFVSLGKPWKTYVQDLVRGGMTEGFEPIRVKFHGGAFSGLDGRFGLLGVGIGASKEGARAWTEVVARTSHIELDYWQTLAGGSFDVFIDGARAGHVVTRAQHSSTGYIAFDLVDAPHQVEVRACGDGEVSVFGMTLDRAQVGVVVDALGINGAEVFTPLRWNEEHFAGQLRHRAPDLVILAYGTNESLESKLSDADYEHGLVDLLGRIARATPSASCLILGPPDRAIRVGPREGWASAPRLVEIVQIQRRVARAAGCAFYDQLEAMGGSGSMAAWASEPDPRGARDRVHLTRSGYAQLAASFAGDLMQAYDQWRSEPGPHRVAPKTWGMAAR